MRNQDGTISENAAIPIYDINGNQRFPLNVGGSSGNLVCGANVSWNQFGIIEQERYQVDSNRFVLYSRLRLGARRL